MAHQVDYLIIGQGLAGSLLGWELMQRGCKIMLVDNQLENASQVAAGLINPVTGMRLVKSEDVDYLLPHALQSYQALGEFFQQDFYIKKPLLRVIRQEKEVAKYQQRLTDPNYTNFLSPKLQEAPNALIAPRGIIQQQQTGYLSTTRLLSQLKAFFQAQGCYQAQQFDYAQLSFDAESVSWQTIRAKKVIFCEGYQAINNPWFNYLPFQLAKGEILSLSTEETLIPEMLNYGRWFIPLTEHQFRIGASFENKQLNTQINHEVKEDLLAALFQIYPSLQSAKLEAHQANIRPTTLDKAPFIGLHPKQPQLAIFNGFGSKGSLQIPFYSAHFAEHLLHNMPLKPQVAIDRVLTSHSHN